jgi:hypothetical protein
VTPDWAARKKQAAELLDRAEKALLPPDEQMQLEKQAADLSLRRFRPTL